MITNRIVRRLKSDIFIFLNRKHFVKIGKRTRIYSPLKVYSRENISIGNNVKIEYKTWLAATPLDDAYSCKLEIGDGTCIGHFNHIYATRSIIIGRNVLTADKVYITDNFHGHEDISTPIMFQPLKQLGEVIIGDGSWLGENVCVLGVKIGKNCVIGSNSVVTKNIPDFSVAVGIPAVIIKRYNTGLKKWGKTNPDGSFLQMDSDIL